LAQQLQGIQDEVAAIRPMQGPGANQMEIRDEWAESREVLDASNQIRVGRMLLLNNR
jgi:hypothetical protein